MTAPTDQLDLFATPLCDLHKRDLRDVMNDTLDAARASPELARTVHAIRHAAEYAVMAAEMLLEGDRSGRIVSPEQALEWASITLAEVWDGANVLTPKVYCS